MAIVATEDRVRIVWNWCSEAYAQQGGRRLSLPKNTDPTKTYQWRFARHITDRLTEWGLEDDLARRLLRITVTHAKERGVLNKGLALFCQGNLLKVCYERLLHELKTYQGELEDLLRIRRWYVATVGDRRDQLLVRPNPDADSYLLSCYRRQLLSDLYLALSADCDWALQQFRPSERSQIPSPAKLYMLRFDLTRNQTAASEARMILGKDWKQCL